MVVTDKVKDRLSKLKAHMESAKAIGSEKEAQAFSEMLQDLLLKYKLSMADVGEVREKEEPILQARVDYTGTGIPFRHKRVGWLEFLGQIVAEAYNCRLTISLNSNLCSFVGTETDTQVAIFAYVTIGRLARDLATKESGLYAASLKRQGLPHQPGFRQAFLQGFCQRLRQRLEESRKVILSDSTALVRVLDKQKAALAKYMSIHFTHGAPMPPRYNDNNLDGYARGRAVADTIDLNKKGVTGNNHKDTKRIGG